MPDVIVIGAGISGLTAAYRLAKAGKDVLLLESSDSVGGKIQSERIDGYLLEAGPNSLRIENHETVDLIEECGLTSRIIDASPNSKKRFILRGGHWVKIPSNPIEAITSPLFSFASKIRVLGELLTSRSTEYDESVESFFTRHFGREVFKYAVEPFVSGIYAGDSSRLSARHTFQELWNLDHRYGSIILGMLLRPKTKDPNPVERRIISFPEGLGELTHALRERLQSQILFHQAELTVQRNANEYVLSSAEQQFSTKQIIFALPADKAGELLYDLLPAFGEVLVNTEFFYPPVAVAYLGYRQDQFPTLPEGFGGLIPAKENRKILGVIFSSSNFPGRAPKNRVLVTVIAGGATQPQTAHCSNEEIITTAESEISKLFHVRGVPEFRRARLWKQAIPQYNMGYWDVVINSLTAAEQELPGLHFIGNYRGGISMGACIKNATELANRLV